MVKVIKEHLGRGNYKRELKPKKSLGQHFLIDDAVSYDIAHSVTDDGGPILEIGPGTGALTKHLYDRFGDRLMLCEIDKRSIKILEKKYPKLSILEEDFLQLNLDKYFPKGLSVVGNFPYNISSQIVFKVLENRDLVKQCTGMFQKEVAERICASPGSKQYGQMTVFRDIDYAAEYLFTVAREAFDPPPKVLSGVLKMTRKESIELPISRKEFFRFVKQAFSQRRKKMRNSLASYFPKEYLQNSIFDMRPEQLSLQEFIDLSKATKK